MLYIHRTTCISPQHSFPPAEVDLTQLIPSTDNQLLAREPSYEGIPPGALRRMGKATRLGIGAALPLLREPPAPSGILIGTAHAGMEESIQFMRQIIEHDEGLLAPGAFVQSMPNSIAAQIGLITRNTSYNITHIQGGLSFENALLDAAMLINEQPPNAGSPSSSNPSPHDALASSSDPFPAFPFFLVGGVDEIGTHNYNIDRLQGWFKTEPVSNQALYESNSPGSLAGEGAAMFLVSGQQSDTLARLEALTILHTEDPATLTARLHSFLTQHLPPGEKIDLLLSGENGDSRFQSFFTSCERALQTYSPITSSPSAFTSSTNSSVPSSPIPSSSTPATSSALTIARFKHVCGEYPTASAFALWLACQLVNGLPLPKHMLKYATLNTAFRRILIYNNHKGYQHSFMLVSTTN
jgi:hypothetical protein